MHILKLENKLCLKISFKMELVITTWFKVTSSCFHARGHKLRDCGHESSTWPAAGDPERPLLGRSRASRPVMVPMPHAAMLLVSSLTAWILRAFESAAPWTKQMLLAVVISVALIHQEPGGLSVLGLV